nr:FecR family protein [Pedobacter sp. ASV19]
MKIKGDKYLQEKFGQYQSGSLTDLERSIIDDWFEEKKKGDSLNIHTNQLLAEQIRSTLYSGIQHSIDQKDKKQNPFKWLKIACMLFLISGVCVLTFRQPNHPKQDKQDLVRVFNTANSQHKKITLEDGTQIWLNSATKLSVAANFTNSNFRKVYLEHGEAFFQVKKDRRRPFKVITQNFTTTVLGTSFNIKSYAELNTYNVAVTSGKVKVDYLGKPLAKGLTPNEVLTYNLVTEQKMINKQEVSLLSKWKSNHSVYLENLTLAQIGTALSRQYNIEVKVTSPQKDKKTYTLFLANQPIQQAVQRIALQTGMSYQLTKYTLTLNPNPL